MAANNSMGRTPVTATDLFLAILAILLIGVSFYQTWVGLEQIFGGSSFIIALVLALIMLFLLWQIRLARLKGQPTGALKGIYVFFALFCFIANFNALYTRFMRNDIYTTELRKLSGKFNELNKNVEANLHYGVQDTALRKSITLDIAQLKSQITDPANKGIGKESAIILKRITAKIGKPLTPLRPSSNTQEGYNDLAERMERQINDAVNSLSPEERQLKEDADKAARKWTATINDELAKPKAVVNQEAQAIIDQALTDYNKIGNKADNLLHNSKYKFEPETSDTQEIGKIGFAFTHAVQNFGMYELVVLLGCILLDFGIMIIISLAPVDHSNNNNGRNSGNTSVFNGKRRGTTLIPYN